VPSFKVDLRVAQTPSSMTMTPSPAFALPPHPTSMLQDSVLLVILLSIGTVVQVNVFPVLPVNHTIQLFRNVHVLLILTKIVLASVLIVLYPKFGIQ